jgi:hypothetical protein
MGLVGQDVVHQGGFTGTEVAGEDGHRDSRVFSYHDLEGLNILEERSALLERGSTLVRCGRG